MPFTLAATLYRRAKLDLGLFAFKVFFFFFLEKLRWKPKGSIGFTRFQTCLESSFLRGIFFFIKYGSSDATGENLTASPVFHLLQKSMIGIQEKAEHFLFHLLMPIFQRKYLNLAIAT